MKPIILIDARFWSAVNGGLSKYTRGLIYNLAKLKNSPFRYIILTYKEHPSLANNFQVIPTHIPHYSFSEQALFFLIKRYRPALVHYLHFNHPLLTPSPFIVTLHDLIKNHFPQPKDTSHNFLMYKVKRWGYTLTLKNALYYSQRIITPTQAVKNQITSSYPIPREKIIPIYEGVFFKTQEINPLPIKLPSKYLLYVGSFYQHKNIGFLIKNINLIHQLNLNLVMVTPKRINLNWKEILREKRILFFSQLKESQLRYLYKNCYAFISPSLMEGFGLPVAEAFSFNKPALLSNIPAFREITHQRMLYFSPNSSQDLENKLQDLIQNYSFYEKMSENLKNYFDFHTTAMKTHQLYREIVNI